MKLKLLNTIDHKTIDDYRFLLLPWRSDNIEITIDEHKVLHDICYDLLLLDFVQVMFNLTGKNYIVFSNNLGKNLRTDGIKMTALNLRLLHFSRISLLTNLESNITSNLKEKINAKIYGDIPNEVADNLLKNYSLFLSRWVYSPFFSMIYGLQYKSEVEIPEKYSEPWLLFKKECGQLLGYLMNKVGKLLV